MKAISCSIAVVSFLFIISFKSFPQPYKVIESGPEYLIIEFNFNGSYRIADTVAEGRTYQKIVGKDYSYRNPGEPWLPEFQVLAGIPFNCNPTFRIIDKKQSILKNKFIVPYPEEDPDLVKQDLESVNKEIYSKNEFFPVKDVILGESYIVRYAKFLPIMLAPYQFNPVTRELIYNNYFKIRIEFNTQSLSNIISYIDGMTDEILQGSVINYEAAKNFTGKMVKGDSPSISDPSWYDPAKNYFKIYVNRKDVFRVTYEELISAGVQLGSNTPIKKLEIFNDGLPVPIDVFDNDSDSVFNNGDYFQFIGFPPTPTPYCSSNIYNLTNVYWFSYQSDSTGLNYIKTPNSIPAYNRSYFSNLTTIHFEKDSLYERLGYAPDEQRDFWFWEKATASGGVPTDAFGLYFENFPNRFADSHYVRLKIAMQGLTNSTCQPDHKAYIMLNERSVGSIQWEGQEDVVFNRRFYDSPDSIPIYPGNWLIVEVRGDVCWNDEIRINWCEFDYWRGNSIYGEYYNFINYDNSGVNRYAMYDWEGSDFKVYIPSKSKMIYSGTAGSFMQFVDTMQTTTEYFLTSSAYYSNVDSIVADTPSDLRNTDNGADYIIITHEKFKDVANQLANLRASNFPDQNIPNPRIEVVEIQQIYDEFSFGLLKPEALKDFVKYAFENWELPAPSYVVLFGDMSYDYRQILQSSRPNFIPSIPFLNAGYGQAASDNLIVAVTGTDPAPDLAIGRLSVESVEEADILLQKLIDYPEDPSKPWKQNVLMLASGLNLQDEIQFGFNDNSLYLGNNYVKPNGYFTSYVFRYPSKPEHEPYQGEGPKIREEINKGAILINYYGHGGGYQWDLVFTNEDIYLLENNGRQPVILSVTCYTAHFDNQNVFGEQFNKVNGKGSIGFYGSSGLTYWGVGRSINHALFDEIFNLRNFVIGKAIMNSKIRTSSGGGLFQSQINLLTYLGDPVMKLALPNYPDFAINSNDITIDPENPLVGDSIMVKLKIANWGTIFPNDSVTVELNVVSSDTSYLVGSVKRGSFSEADSVYFLWVPDKGGLYTITAKINETERIMEEDHSDNVANSLFVVFDISEPNILTPIDGCVFQNNQVEFCFSDIGYYVSRELKYHIQIDTSLAFEFPIFESGELMPDKSLLKWNSPNLLPGVYFWRARIYDGSKFGNWSPVRSFSIMSESKEGYFAHSKILKTFVTYNINYSEQSKTLVLNTEPLSARPSNKTFLNDFLPSPQLPDSLKLTTITTDGTYLYFANMWFYARELTDGMSMIYRVGTGNNGTVEGQFYGSFSSFRDTILNHIVYHSDGYIYVAIGKSDRIVRISTTTEEIDTVLVPPGLLRWDRSTATDGPQYLTSDGQYIYNLTIVDSLGNPQSKLRTFDPSNNWSLAKPDVDLFGVSFYQGFTGFFVHGNYVYTCEYFSNFMRKYRNDNGIFIEEWLVREPYPTNFQHYFSWCLDWEHDKIYASVFQYPQIDPKFGKFAGYYVDANGTITTKSVGPVAWWNSLKYDLDNPSPTGEFTAYLLGQNSITKTWDTLQVDIPDSLSLSGIDADTYSNLRIRFDLTDSSFTTTEPLSLRNVQFDYQALPDVYFEREDFHFLQDSLLQGYPVTFEFISRNFGEISADSLKLNFYLNGLDSIIYASKVNIPPDSQSNKVSYTIETEKLLFENEVRVLGSQKKREYFYFNNLIGKQFFIARDSLRPQFNITFDGIEIIDGDIVSSEPEVVITLEDNSPLPIDTSYFTLVHTEGKVSKILRFADPDLEFDYQTEPVSRAIVTWTPELLDGDHLLEVLAKDASGNFFDSTSYRVKFSVYTENDITNFYNYPNPFRDGTHFTFLLRGNEKPDELNIKIYTIAGRLIWDYSVPTSSLITNFNKIYWNGRDQDGDEISNGVYFYKVIAKFPDKTKTITQKLAKVK